ncbi:unnamed protein product [Cyprideis torosa]|uniref:Adenylate kinase isoenzyme 6 homolog n=1 Tax=Cyprideis torosa TaxID=163714 RepID=A0A7R8WAW0_9CRUS|nr:unnamed protein product [Cyprideis torosa]CAG0888798.1 unnamed protein product [Cyprideis torosa]
MGKRLKPNVLVTGTPGTGKSSFCEEAAERTGLKHVNVSEVAKEKGYTEGYDPEYDTAILDEDALLDDLEEVTSDGGVIVDYHSAELFPKRWFDLVLVLRTDNTILYDRLSGKRGYSGKKLSENMECEIMGTLLEEAKEAYDQEIVHELRSDTMSDMEQNIERLCVWLKNWCTNNQEVCTATSSSW